MAVLAVVLTAPMGALAISLLGPVLLKKKISEGGPPEEGVSPPPAPEDQLPEEGKAADNGKSGTYEGML